MPRITHPNGTTAVVPAAAVRFWTTKAGWHLDDPPSGGRVQRPARKRSRPRKPAAPKTSPAPTAGAPDDVAGQGSSTTAHTEE